jgi:AcrR family transcriptional regulator
MKGTKQNILRAARILFNERGVSNVSQRLISDHIAISPGNLTYHFKKRSDILEALYFEYAQEMEEHIASFNQHEANLSNLAKLAKSLSKIGFDNRFFTIDFVQIIRENVKIKKHHQTLVKQRQNQLETVLKKFEDQGIIRAQEIADEYKMLLMRLELLSDYWLIFIGTNAEEVLLKNTRTQAELFMQSIYPYLTQKGKSEFKLLST